MHSNGEAEKVAAIAKGAGVVVAVVGAEGAEAVCGFPGVQAHVDVCGPEGDEGKDVGGCAGEEAGLGVEGDDGGRRCGLGVCGRGCGHLNVIWRYVQTGRFKHVDGELLSGYLNIVWRNIQSDRFEHVDGELLFGCLRIVGRNVQGSRAEHGDGELWLYWCDWSRV